MVDKTNGVPVYLPDMTITGRAEISSDRRSITLTFPDGPIPELTVENLIGFSVVYLAAEARDQVAAEIETMTKEKKDG